MIKILGFLIIVASSSKIGFDLSQKYSDRTKELRGFISVLERIKNEISFSNCIITDALVKASNVKSQTISSMVKNISKKIEEKNISLSDAFNTYIKENSIALDKKDTDEISRFFSIFGSGDREDEIKNINNSVINLKNNLQTAIEDEKKYVKLFRTGGVFAGFLIAIILA